MVFAFDPLFFSLAIFVGRKYVGVHYVMCTVYPQINSEVEFNRFEREAI